MARQPILDDALWQLIEPLLPKKKRRRRIPPGHKPYYPPATSNKVYHSTAWKSRLRRSWFTDSIELCVTASHRSTLTPGLYTRERSFERNRLVIRFCKVQ